MGVGAASLSSMFNGILIKIALDTNNEISESISIFR
jgi:hypothetical protein